ncbi:MAG: cytochrome c family protein [Hyphomicrobium sp.]|uniref:c-type cytochrome n=1 Tax=Hyphomicrobium sp. TaxID=82 RepID=UPI0013224C65|nr:cytochrome c family protein [Hyphomicrobium sp.]KAB2943628.1 MAG: cytochrome c family protein [Hyphomicrobium sp.]MBZ0208907.1 cytochrome c family protein [Hyphomicrobium sp.]
MRKIVVSIAAVACLANAASAQDRAEGEKVFATCKACHQIGEGAKNAIGPQLNGIVGRKAGSVPGYNYSDANKNSDIMWDQSSLAEYLKDPKAKVPGTKMVFAGIKDEQKVQDLIAFLRQFDAAGKKAQ